MIGPCLNQKGVFYSLGSFWPEIVYLQTKYVTAVSSQLKFSFAQG